jgi:hypothetical protein
MRSLLPELVVVGRTKADQARNHHPIGTGLSFTSAQTSACVLALLLQ